MKWNMAKYGEKKIIKVASWQPQGRVKKDKESVNNVVRTAVFHCRYHANQFLLGFFLLFFSQAPTMRGDSAVRISLHSQRVWQCFGSATNLNALITNTVTLPPDWEIHFVSSQEMHCIDSAIARHRAPPPPILPAAHLQNGRWELWDRLQM